MAVQKILTIPNPLLRQKSKGVAKISAKGGPASGWDKKLLNLVKDLKDTLAAQENPRGVGISAPQIGKLYQVCLVFSRKSKKFLTFINPEIIWNSKRMVKSVPESKNPYEGCLSVPGYWGQVKRHKEVKVRYLTENGQAVIRKFSGFTSVVIQHEIDHLEGILFIDKILKQKGKLYKLEKDKEDKDLFVEVEFE